MELFIKITPDHFQATRTALQACVYALIDGYTRSGKECVMTYEQIAEVFSTSRRSVIRTIADLCELGLVRKVRKETSNGIRYAFERCQNVTPKGDKMTPFKVTKRHPLRCQNVTPTYIDNNNKIINKISEISRTRVHAYTHEQEAERLPEVATPLNAEQSVEVATNHARVHRAVLRQFLAIHKITPEEFERLSAEIATEWLMAGVTHKDNADARHHFMSLIRIKAQELRKNQPIASVETLTAELDEAHARNCELANAIDNIDTPDWLTN